MIAWCCNKCPGKGEIRERWQCLKKKNRSERGLSTMDGQNMQGMWEEACLGGTNN